MAQTSTTKCNLCDTNNGMFFCYECKSALCGPCRKTHDKIPATQNHSITDLTRVDRSSFSSVSSCQTHKQEFSLYCTTCKILICSKCVATKHKGHDFSEIETVVEDLRNSVKLQVAETKVKLQTLSSSIDEIRTLNLRAVGEDAQQLRSKIDSAVKNVQIVLDQKKNTQISEIDDFESLEKQEMQNAVESKERILTSSTAICSSLEKMLAEEHGVTFLNGYKALKLEYDELDDGLKDLQPYSCIEINQTDFYKDVIKSIIQAANNALRDEGKPEMELLDADGLENTKSLIPQSLMEFDRRHLFNFVRDVKNFQTEDDRQKAEKIYIHLLEKEKALKTIFENKQIVGVDIRYQTMKKLVRLPNGLYEELASYRSRDAKEIDLTSSCLRRKNIRINGDRLSFKETKMNDVGLYIANYQLGSAKLYFEVEIVALGINGTIGVGLVHDEYSLIHQPGWNPGSIGFHADDGRIYIESGRGRPYGPSSNVGDIIGCRIHIPPGTSASQSPLKACVFFTHNGKKLDTIEVNYPSGGFFPAVGLHCRGAIVKLHLNEIVTVAEDETEQIITQMDQSTKEKRTLLDGSLFRETHTENILTSAIKNNIRKNPAASVAGWEYYNLKRSYDTLQSVHTDKREKNEQLFEI
ncbi:Hypothetical predicted protein [Mytilus galloprovincialis]|uniref:B box-type domain-containing protein n=1 Tax=Mytilus galloprovincialis TaxID=29158 RepID=A0A8B6D9A0_MYTGA|nr:Hypothetical predicted protein [Mytilus galloprovincialis]